MLTPQASPNTRIRSRLTVRKNSKNYLVVLNWGSRKDDPPAHAGILASFEPKGEKPLVTFVTPDWKEHERSRLGLEQNNVKNLNQAIFLSLPVTRFAFS